jgi:hypothetical protein
MTSTSTIPETTLLPVPSEFSDDGGVITGLRRESARHLPVKACHDSTKVDRSNGPNTRRGVRSGG